MMKPIMALRACAQCNANISEKAVKCPKCGTSKPFEDPFGVCLECSANIPKDSDVCPECGFPNPLQKKEEPCLVCLECSANIPKESEVCPECGLPNPLQKKKEQANHSSVTKEHFLHKALTGIKLEYYSIIIICAWTVFFAFGIISLFSMHGEDNWILYISNLFLLVIFTMTVVGKYLCIGVTSQINGKFTLYGSLCCDIVIMLISIIAAFIDTPPLFFIISTFISFIGFLLFLLFLRKLATFLNEEKIRQMAGNAVDSWIICIVALCVMFFSPYLISDLPGLIIIAIILIMFIVGLISLLRYARVLHFLIQALTAQIQKA